MKEKFSGVKVARIKVGKTQKEICKEVGISPNTLVKAEKGDFTALNYSSMLRLAKALKTDMKTLFFLEES